MIAFSILFLFGLRFYLGYADRSAKIAHEKDTSYQMIISEIEDGYFRANPEGVLEAISPSTVKMLGHSNVDDIIGRPLSDFYQNPDDRIVMRNRLFSEKTLKNHPLVLKRSDGSLVYITANVHLIYAEDGKITGIEGIAHDNTDALLAEKTLHEGESFYRLIFESANIGLFQCTADGVVLLVNPVFAFTLGYSGPDQMVREKVNLIETLGLDSEGYDRLREELSYQGAVRNLEISLKKRDETQIWLNINVVVIKDFSDQAAVYFGTAIDITEKKKMEAWLIENQQKFQSLFYFSPVAIFVYNTNGTLIDSNSAAISLFGASEKSLPESENLFFRAYLDDDEKEALSSGKVVKREILMDFDTLREKYHIPSSHPGIRYLDLMVTPIPGPDNLPKWFLVQISDITERKEAEIARIVANERLKEAEVIARLGHWELDLKKDKLFWSDELYSIFEKIPRQFIPTYDTFLRMIHPEDRGMVDEAFQHHIRNKIPYDIVYRIKLADNRIKYVRGISKTEWDEEGLAVRSVGIIHDITNTRLNELALRESELKYRQMFSNVSLGLILFEFTDEGEPGRIMDLNPKAQEMLQKTLLEILIGHNQIQSYLPISGSSFVKDLSYIDADICSFKSGIIRNDNDILPVQVTLDIFRLEKTVVGLAILEDITIKNQYEEERIGLIKQIEKNLAELSILNDGVRNPLTVIMLLVDELEKEISDPVLAQIKNIDELISQLDQRWIESDKILQYLQKHHHITYKKEKK
ncbi:PAS domain S-box protein [Methanospirillum stamsii]|uniref:histidine kinase n=1 Tax=Methanospirillum stamsii TaxID=1277351 RepID=A0A2V2N789_9EURY|nr:PAS domain S-box protein [Methanospirillum stamsii]PWR75924.1 hypothetical protein DLD82_02365 [Methanospirillum stamsii]